MAASEHSARAEELQPLLEALSQKLAHLPDPLKAPLEEDLRKIRAVLDQPAPSPGEARYRELAESISDGFFELDCDWRFAYINQRAAANIGRLPEDLLGRNIWETFPLLCGTPLETNYRQVMAERRPANFEMAGAITGKVYIIRVYPSANGLTVFWVDITERKQAEDALRESEASLARSSQRVSEVLSSITDDFYVLDRNWVFVYASRQFTSRIGKEPEDFVGRNIWEMFPNHIGSVLYENFHASMEKGEKRRFEVSGKYTDVWYSMTSFPSADGITVLGTDITERVRAEEEIRKLFETVEQEKARLQSVINNMPDEVWFVDATGRLEMVNEQVLKAFGPLDIDGQDAGQSAYTFAAESEVYRPDGSPRPPGEAPPLRALRGEEVRDLEEIVRLPSSGELRYRQVSAAPVRGPEGAIIGSVAVVRDMTERRKAETALREAQARLRIALDATRLGIYDYDVPAGSLQCDSRVRELWGIGPGEPITVEAFLAGVHPQDLEIAQAAMQRAYEPHSSGSYQVEFRVIDRATRAERWIAVTGIISFDDQQAVRVVGTVQDISGLRRLEEERVEALTRIAVQRRLMEQREKDRHAIARDLHDGPIQTLSSSLFNLHMVKEAFPDPSLKNELDLVAHDIKGTIQELRDLLNELRPPALLHFGLSKVMRMFLEDFRTRFPEIELVVEITEEDQALSNDAHLTLFRIFQAGMNNIVRHSEASKVWVVFRAQPDCYLLSVRDNGKGFHIKQDYSQLTRTGHFGLVGIKERAEVIGGELILSSEPGRGTTLTVKIPRLS